MKRAYSKPVMLFVPMTKGVNMNTLSEKPAEELAKILRRCKEAEERKIYQANPNVVIRQIGDEWLLVPTGAFAQQLNGMISLNKFSYFIWEQLQQPKSLGEVIEAAKMKYNDKNQVMDLQIREFFNKNLQIGLFYEIKSEI